MGNLQPPFRDPLSLFHRQRPVRIPKPVSTRWSYAHRTLLGFFGRKEELEDALERYSRARRNRSQEELPGMKALKSIMKKDHFKFLKKASSLLKHVAEAVRTLEGNSVGVFILPPHIFRGEISDSVLGSKSWSWPYPLS